LDVIGGIDGFDGRTGRSGLGLGAVCPGRGIDVAWTAVLWLLRGVFGDIDLGAGFLHVVVQDCGIEALHFDLSALPIGVQHFLVERRGTVQACGTLDGTSFACRTFLERLLEPRSRRAGGCG